MTKANGNAGTNKAIYSHGALFDLDGVLIDSEGIYTEFWKQIDREYPTGVKDFAHVIKGNTLDRILTTYFDQALHPAILKLLRQQEEEMVYRPFPGVIEFMNGLRQAGWGIAIVTSSNMRKMEGLFSQVPQMAEAFDVLVTDGDVKNSKPAPEGYLLAARRLSLEPACCTVFEDSLAGLKAGRNAGCRVVAVATTNPREVVEPLADITVDFVTEFRP